MLKRKAKIGGVNERRVHSLGWTCFERCGGGMKAVLASRRQRLFYRLFICAVGLVAVTCFAQILHVTAHSKEDSDLTWARRKLTQQIIEENQTSSTPRAAIHEFPEDIFTKGQRRHGAILLHVFCAVYMFYALAIVCDVYFVPSLEKICKNLHLSEDVAGATFMAAGSSAPELFTSLIGVFITKGDLGVGTIVGSAVFNILVIIGVCGIFAGQTITLTWWPLFRDSIYYTLSVLALILIIYDEKVIWWETIILISMYGVYILIMKFNSQIWGWVEQRFGIPGQQCLVSSLRRDVSVGEASPHCDTSMILLKKGQNAGGQDSPVVMVDELMSLHPHQFSFSEASLRVMITPHFSPRTRLSMAGRMLITERQRLIRNRSPGDSSGSGAGDTPGQDGPGMEGVPWANKSGDNGGSPLRVKRKTSGVFKPRQRVVQGGDFKIEDRVPKDDEEDEEEEADKVFLSTEGRWEQVRWVLSWPLGCLLYYTVPNCVLPRWERWFMVTFVASTLWIAVFSYLMVWMVTIISFTLDIPDVVMGITFLAAGTSVPDCMASLIVARQGMGDMAVSNSIGSNIFDILLGLGFPWALRTLVVDYGSTVFINSRGLVYSVILLLASVFLTVLSVHLNHWRLDRRLGLGLMFLYAIFLLCSICFEKL
ncbi:LOW QUALITY PROTEIN: sodium/potassium/calcium exchanger 3-like [Cyprinus carpio]|uniref:LOW QUALITY PROTEIN: sodium/potassium/calcium exchanger 3-like n=1 Tax=Cyprinus carpio TaxID=7962 RepID=A0A9Q9X317_CYPCA|nr:LOW QUALITY PROTEIN: sodium/potassium/calcium exchanger 3-like [Cyprinus carpio]